MPTARELLAEKYLKDPDFIPPKGKTKEEVAGEIVDQKIRQSRNNNRAFQLLAKEQDNAMWTWDRDKDAVQKPIERKKDRFIVREMTKDSPTKFKDPSKEHMRVMHRTLEVLPGNAGDYKVDDPPEVDSEEFEAELKHVKSAAQFLDGDPSLEATIKEQDKDLIKPFTDYADENNLSVDEDFLNKLAEDIVSIVMFWKYKYNQPRPYQFDGYPEMENTTADTPSYPSGHSTQTKVIGEVLARSYPKHADNFRRIGDNIGVNRVIAGWHYPVDHTAGHDLADQIIKKLPDNVEMFLKKASFAEDDYMLAIKSAMDKHAVDFNIPINAFKALLSKGIDEIEEVAQALKDEGIFSTGGNARNYLMGSGVNMDSTEAQLNEVAERWRSFHRSKGEGAKPITGGKVTQDKTLADFKAFKAPAESEATETPTDTAPTGSAPDESAPKPEYYVIGDRIEQPGITPPRANARPATVADLANPNIEKPDYLPEDHAEHPQFGGVTVDEYLRDRAASDERVRTRTEPLKVTQPEKLREAASEYGITFETTPKGVPTIKNTAENRRILSGVFSRNLPQNVRDQRSKPLVTAETIREQEDNDPTLVDYPPWKDAVKDALEAAGKEQKRRQDAYGLYQKHLYPIQSAEDSKGAKFQKRGGTLNMKDGVMGGEGTEVDRDHPDAEHIPGTGKSTRNETKAREATEAFKQASESEQDQMYLEAVKEMPDLIHVNTTLHNSVDLDPNWKIDDESVDPDPNLIPRTMQEVKDTWERQGTSEEQDSMRHFFDPPGRDIEPPSAEQQAKIDAATASRERAGDIQGGMRHIDKMHARWLGAQLALWTKPDKNGISYPKPLEVPQRLASSKLRALQNMAEEAMKTGGRGHYSKDADHHATALAILQGADPRKLGVKERDKVLNKIKKAENINYKDSDADDEIPPENNISVTTDDVAEMENKGENNPDGPTLDKAKAQIEAGTREMISGLIEQRRAGAELEDDQQDESDEFDPNNPYPRRAGDEAVGSESSEGDFDDEPATTSSPAALAAEAAAAAQRAAVEQDNEAARAEAAAQEGTDGTDSTSDSDSAAAEAAASDQGGVETDPMAKLKRSLTSKINTQANSLVNTDVVGGESPSAARANAREIIWDSLDAYVEKYEKENDEKFPIEKKGILSDLGKAIRDYHAHEAMGGGEHPLRNRIEEHIANINSSIKDENFTPTPPVGHIPKPDEEQEGTDAEDASASDAEDASASDGTSASDDTESGGTAYSDALNPSQLVHLDVEGGKFNNLPMTSVELKDGTRQAFIRNEDGSWKPITGVKNVLSEANGVPYGRFATDPYNAKRVRESTDKLSVKKENLSPFPNTASYETQNLLPDDLQAEINAAAETLEETGFGSNLEDSTPIKSANEINKVLNSTTIRSNPTEHHPKGERLGSHVDSKINSDLDAIYDHPESLTDGYDSAVIHELSWYGNLQGRAKNSNAELRRHIEENLDDKVGNIDSYEDDQFAAEFGSTATDPIETETDSTNQTAPQPDPNKPDPTGPESLPTLHDLEHERQVEGSDIDDSPNSGAKIRVFDASGRSHEAEVRILFNHGGAVVTIGGESQFLKNDLIGEKGRAENNQPYYMVDPTTDEYKADVELAQKAAEIREKVKIPDRTKEQKATLKAWELQKNRNLKSTPWAFSRHDWVDPDPQPASTKPDQTAPRQTSSGLDDQRGAGGRPGEPGTTSTAPGAASTPTEPEVKDPEVKDPEVKDPEVKDPETGGSGSGEDEPPEEPFKFNPSDPRPDAFRRQVIEHLQQGRKGVLETLIDPAHEDFHNEAEVLATLLDKKKTNKKDFSKFIAQARDTHTENAARAAKQTPEVVQGLADKLQRDDLKEVVQAHIDAHVAQNNDRPNHDAQYHDVNSYAEHLQSLSEKKRRQVLEAHHTKAESLKAAREREEETQSKEERKEAATKAIQGIGQVDSNSTQHHFEEVIRRANQVEDEHSEAIAEDPSVKRDHVRVIGAVTKVARNTPAGQEALKQVKSEIEEHGDKFGGTDHKAQVEAAHDAAKEDHEDHEKHLNTANNRKFGMRVFHGTEAIASQNQREFGPEDAKQVQGERDKGKNEADIRKDRIARGQAPGPAPRPNLKWHKETHRWINPDTYNDIGKTLKIGENVHIGDPHSMGLAHHEDDTPDGGMVLHKHEDGQVRMYSAAQSKANKYGLNSLISDEAHNPTNNAHARALAAGHLARTGNLKVSEAELRSRMSAHAGASAMERDFVGKRNKAFRSIARSAAIGAGLGALAGGGFLPAGAIVGAGLAYMGVKNKSKLFRARVAQDMRNQLGTPSPEESAALDRFASGGAGLGASSALSSAVGAGLGASSALKGKASGAVGALASKFGGGSKD